MRRRGRPRAKRIIESPSDDDGAGPIGRDHKEGEFGTTLAAPRRGWCLIDCACDTDGLGQLEENLADRNVVPSHTTYIGLVCSVGGGYEERCPVGGKNTVGVLVLCSRVSAFV